MNNKVERYSWEDALIEAQARGLIKNGALLLALKLAKAINWKPKGGKPSGLYWKNAEALRDVGASRSTYFEHRKSLVETGFLTEIGGNLIPMVPDLSLVETVQEGIESLPETSESVLETEQSVVETPESVVETPYSEDIYSEDSLSEDDSKDVAVPVGTAHAFLSQKEFDSLFGDILVNNLLLETSPIALEAEATPSFEVFSQKMREVLGAAWDRKTPKAQEQHYKTHIKTKEHMARYARGGNK